MEYQGKLAAFGGYQMAESLPELWQLGLIVAPAFRRQGLGGLLYAQLCDELRQRGAQQLLTRLEAGQEAGRRFLGQRGFAVVGSMLVYQLDLAVACTAGWGDPDLHVAAQGLRFTTFDRMPRQRLAERLLPLWNRSRPDQPQRCPYQPYSAQRLEREMLEPDAVALEHCFALFSADNQIVAMLLNAWLAVGHLCTTYLGVDPAFRQRGLAMALKQKLVAQARAHGVALLSAENDAANHAMRAINTRLGFQPLAELLDYECHLNACATST